MESPNTPRAKPWIPFNDFILYSWDFLHGVSVMPQPIRCCFKSACNDIIIVLHLCSYSLLWFETTYLNPLIVYSIVLHTIQVACVGPLGVLYTKWRLGFTLDHDSINYHVVKGNQLAFVFRRKELAIILLPQKLLKNPKLKFYFHSSPKKQRLCEIIKATTNCINMEI